MQTTSAAPETSTISTIAGQSTEGDQHYVILDENSPGYTAEGEIISTQTVSSKTRTVETITVSLNSVYYDISEHKQLSFLSYCPFLQYKTERDGIVETRVEQKITIQSDGDPIDHDKALAEAIQVTKMIYIFT